MCKNIFLHVKALYEPTMKIKTLLLYTKSKLKYVLVLTLKEPGYFDPSHSRRGADSAPLKISETDR